MVSLQVLGSLPFRFFAYVSPSCWHSHASGSYSASDGLPLCSVPALRASWLPGFCLITCRHSTFVSFSSTVPGFAPSPRLLSRGLHRQQSAGSPAIAAFPAGFLTTIPSYDCSPPIATTLTFAVLTTVYRFCGDGRALLGSRQPTFPRIQSS